MNTCIITLCFVDISCIRTLYGAKGHFHTAGYDAECIYLQGVGGNRQHTHAHIRLLGMQPAGAYKHKNKTQYENNRADKRQFLVKIQRNCPVLWCTKLPEFLYLTG